MPVRAVSGLRKVVGASENASRAVVIESLLPSVNETRALGTDYFLATISLVFSAIFVMASSGSDEPVTT